MTDYQFYKRMGICPSCRKYKLYGDENLCIECKAYFANKQQKRRNTDNERIKNQKMESYKKVAEFRNENNLCTKCGKPRTDNHKMCGICRAKNTIKCRETRNKKGGKIEQREEDGLCRFCDNKRKVGYKVCELHHKRLTALSRSREKVKINRQLVDSKKLF